MSLPLVTWDMETTTVLSAIAEETAVGHIWYFCSVLQHFQLNCVRSIGMLSDIISCQRIGVSTADLKEQKNLNTLVHRLVLLYTYWHRRIFRCVQLQKGFVSFLSYISRSESLQIRSYRAATVCLGVLCVLLLLMWVYAICHLHFKNNQLTNERDQLLTKNANLTEKINQLVIENNKLENMKYWFRSWEGFCPYCNWDVALERFSPPLNIFG